MAELLPMIGLIFQGLVRAEGSPLSCTPCEVWLLGVESWCSYDLGGVVSLDVGVTGEGLTVEAIEL